VGAQLREDDGGKSQLSQHTRGEVVSVIEHYRDRFNANDADGLAEIYAPDISFVNLAGRTFVGRQAIRDQQDSGFHGPLVHIRIELDVTGLSTLGRDHVLALVRQTIIDLNADGATSASTMTIILDKTSGSWLIRHLQNTPVSAVDA